MVHHDDVEPLIRRAGHPTKPACQTSPYVTSRAISRAHTGASSHRKERALNIPNKLWHKAAPLLITVATILSLIVILHH
jgi:hypothetical protein